MISGSIEANADANCDNPDTTFDQEILSGEYPTHIYCYKDESKIKGFLIRTTQNVYNFGGLYADFESNLLASGNILDL